MDTPHLSPSDDQIQQIKEANELEQRARKTRLILFGLLFLASSLPLFKTLNVPNEPTQAAVDLYSTLMEVPDGSTVLVQTDWTNSTRGESGGEFEALLRILMRKNCKLAIYSMGDPQAPQVAEDDIMILNDERKLKGEREYKTWDDFVSIGFFPNAEGATAAMAASLKSAWSGKKDVNPQGIPEDVFDSPVLKGIDSVANVKLLAVITPSNTFKVLIQRLYGKVPLVALVTGVMGPESLNYYNSSPRQIKGLAAGMKGVYDLETMMENGINWSPGPGKPVGFAWPNQKTPVPGFPGEKNYGKGKLYFPTLHIDLLLLILAVVAGNVGMFMAKKRGK